MYRIDLNSDLGESFGRYTLGNDERLIPLITSCNIACGFHGGDPLVMEKTVKIAIANNVQIGAHVSYPDLQGFGRRKIDMTEEEIKALVKYQIGALWGFVHSLGGKLNHVKPHGALYNVAAKDMNTARAICKAIKEIDENITLLGLSGSLMKDAAEEADIPFKSEVFADRAYNNDGSLVDRKIKGSVIHDMNLISDRVVRMIKENKVISIDSKDIDVYPDSICIHGDTEGAEEFALSIREALEKEGIEIKPF